MKALLLCNVIIIVTICSTVYMYNDMYCTSTAKFNAFQVCFHGSPTVDIIILCICIALGCNRISSLTKDVQISVCPHIHDIVPIYSIYDYIHCFCSEGLHFSALVLYLQ